jgi:hypothetical protein
MDGWRLSAPVAIDASSSSAVGHALFGWRLRVRAFIAKWLIVLSLPPCAFGTLWSAIRPSVMRPCRSDGRRVHEQRSAPFASLGTNGACAAF